MNESPVISQTTFGGYFSYIRLSDNQSGAKGTNKNAYDYWVLNVN